MADPLTSSIRFTQPTFGGDVDAWGTLLNSNWAYADAAINQALTIAVPNANVVLVADGSPADQARYHRLIFTGALTADRTVTLPAVARDGWATNSTTGGHNVVLSTGSGTPLSVPPASTVFYACTGSGITALSGSIAGGTVSDAVTFNGPVTFNNAATQFNVSPTFAAGLTVTGGGIGTGSFLSALTTNGFEYSASGTLRQWGTTTTPVGGTLAVGFPRTFAGILNVRISARGSIGTQVTETNRTVSSITVASFTTSTGVIGGPVAFDWEAIGT